MGFIFLKELISVLKTHLTHTVTHAPHHCAMPMALGQNSASILPMLYRYAINAIGM